MYGDILLFFRAKGAGNIAKNNFTVVIDVVYIFLFEIFASIRCV